MDSLRDWHRYVDSLSRPVRRQEEEDDASHASWRPWMDSDEREEIAGAVRAEEIPDLAASVGKEGSSETLQPATRDFEDPTIHDELEPLLEHQVPQFQAPTFELNVPSFLSEPPKAEVSAEPQREEAPPSSPQAPVNGAVAAAEPEELPGLPELPELFPTLKSTPPEDIGSKGGASGQTEARLSVSSGHARPPAEASVPRDRIVGAAREGRAEARRNSPDPSQYEARLRQVRGDSGAGNGLRTRSGESREELVQRLADPTLTLEQTALFLGVCPTTVRRYTNRGVLPHFRTEGNQRRFRLSDVLEFLEKNASGIQDEETDAG
jgi:excisionase family DNA binding protein